MKIQKKKTLEFISINSKIKKKKDLQNPLLSAHRAYQHPTNRPEKTICSRIAGTNCPSKFYSKHPLIIHIGSIYSLCPPVSSLCIYIYIYRTKTTLLPRLEWNQERKRGVTFRWTIRIPAGRGEQWRLRRERLPCLDVSFPPAGRKFPFPYGGVCLSLAAGQTGQTQGEEGGKKGGKMAAREKNGGKGEGKSRKNKPELRSLNIRWKLRFACTQT